MLSPRWLARVVLSLALLPLALALGVTAEARGAAPRPVVSATVDHPPADGVVSFDSGPRNSGRVALTFDADMTPGMLDQLRRGQVRSWYNREIKDILDAEQVHATVFLTGLWASAYPDEARALAHDPLIEIGSHTWDHAAFAVPCYGLPAATDKAAEISLARAEIERTTGVTPALVRFPGDCYGSADVEMARQQHLLVISGDVRAGDGFNPSAATVANTVLGRLQAGSIVIMHMHGGANAPMTAPALRAIIAEARHRGLSFGTTSEVLGRAPAAVVGPEQLPSRQSTTIADQLVAWNGPVPAPAEVRPPGPHSTWSHPGRREWDWMLLLVVGGIAYLVSYRLIAWSPRLPDWEKMTRGLRKNPAP